MRLSSLLRGAALFTLATGAIGAAHAQSTTPPLQTSWSGAPQTQQGEQRFKVRGRLQYDFFSVNADFDGDGNNDGDILDAGEGAGAFDQSYNRTATRRFRLGVEGRFSDEWRYKAEVTLLGNSSDGVDEVQFEDVFVEYAGRNFSLIIGNNKAVAPLEEITSSRFITFNERSGMINAFGFGRQVGVAFITNGANWSWGASLSGDSANSSEATNASESWTAITRLTFAPILQQSPDGLHLLHLGGTVRYRDNGDDAAFRYRTRPAGVGFQDRFVDTGAIGVTDTFYGFEAAYVYGPFSLQGEYGWLSAERAAGADQEMSSWYIDGIWNLTGESRNYRSSDGSFQRPTVRSAVGDGGWGAWQIAARYEQTDLTDVVRGGEQSAYTLGLHWYPHPYVGFKLNYGHTDVDDGVGNAAPSLTNFRNGDVDVISLRTQFDF